MIESLLTWTTIASLLGVPGVIANPRVATIQVESPSYLCLTEELRKQAPKGMFGAGAIYVMGPSERRDVAPPGSVIEIMGAAPNSKSLPRFINLSVWLETADQSQWEQKVFADGSMEYRASGVLSPAKVFERVKYRYLFDFDLHPCLEGG